MGSSICQILIFLLLICLPSIKSLDFNYPAVFNFGDSNSDTGELDAGVGRILQSPNGERYFKKPSGRLCDGRLIIDFLMDAMGLPFLNPYLEAIGAPSFRTGCDFASAAAGISPADAAARSPFSLGIQVAQFLSFRAQVEDLRNTSREFDNYIPAQDSFPKALYMFDIGHNDIAGGFFSHQTLEQILASIPSIISEYKRVLKKLYNHGARNFWIHSTSPIGCLPVMIKFCNATTKLDELGCVSSVNQAARAFNEQLHDLCKKFRSQHPDSNVTYVDIFTIKANLIANYSRYGFEKSLEQCHGFGYASVNNTGSIFCCGPRDSNGTLLDPRRCIDSTKYVNWDGIHYTEAGNQHVASQILTGKYSENFH